MLANIRHYSFDCKSPRVKIILKEDSVVCSNCQSALTSSDLGGNLATGLSESNNSAATHVSENVTQLLVDMEKYKQRNLLLQASLLTAKSSVNPAREDKHEHSMLKRQVADLTHQLYVNRAEGSALRDALLETGDRLKRSLLRESNYSSTIEGLKKTNSDTYAAYKAKDLQARMAAERKLAEMKKQLSLLEESLVISEELAESRQSTVDLLEGELLALKARLKEGKDKIAQLEERNAELKFTVSAAQSSLAAESSRVTLLTTLTRTLQKRLSEVQEAEAVASGREISLKEQLERLERSLMQAKNSRTNVDVNVRDVNGDCKKFEASTAPVADIESVPLKLAEGRESSLKSRALPIDSRSRLLLGGISISLYRLFNALHTTSGQGIKDLLFSYEYPDDALFTFSQTLLESR